MRNSRFSVLVLMLFTMFLLGGISNTKGIVLAEVKHTLGLNLAQVGWVVFIFQWGFVLSSILAGYFCDKYGLKTITFVGTLIMIAGILGTAFAKNSTAFFLSYTIVGLGLGTMTVASNAVVPNVYPKQQGKMFNIAMGVYGLGLFLTPLGLRLLFAYHLSWRYFYLGIAALLILFLAYLFWVKVPSGKIEKINFKIFAQMLQKPQFLLVMFFLIFYVAIEVTFTNFLPSYVYSLRLSNSTLSQKQGIVTTLFALFSLFFTLGRFLGGWLISHVGEKRLLVFCSILSFACMLLSKSLAETFIFLFALCGLFFSVLFPTATSIGTKLSSSAGSALGLVYVSAGIGGAFAGWLVGLVSHTMGPAIGFTLPIFFTLPLIIIALFFKKESLK